MTDQLTDDLEGISATDETQAPRRGTLDRARILRAAVGYLDDHGIARLTMRRLGAELGVEAMALYRYVPSREQLLDGVVELVMDDLLADPRVQVEPPHWSSYLRRLALAVREVALAHPQIFPLIASRPPSAPWLRPPLRSLRWVETFLTALDDCGFSAEGSVAVYRGFSTFLLGHLMLEVSARGADVGLIGASEGPAEAPADLARFPHVLRLAPALAVDHGLAEFEESLASLLDRLQAKVSAPA